MFNKKDMMWFANLNCKELKEELKTRGIKGYYKMKKEQLQETLLNLLEQEREEVVVEEELNRGTQQDKEEDDEIERLLREFREQEKQEQEEDEEYERIMREYREFEKQEQERQQRWSEEHGGKQYSFSEAVIEELFKGKLVIPVEGQEDKVNRMLKDLAKIYHPDKPTGDSKMMIFVNEIKKEFRKAN